MNEINNCENCHHYNSLIDWNEGIFHQCLLGNKLWVKCKDYDVIEKRYTIKAQDDLFGVVDNYSADKVCVVNGIRTKIEAEWLCNEMNDLNDDKGQLKKENQQLRMSPRVDVNEIESLVCENEQLNNENEQLKNKIYVLEDDNETYHKSLEKLNLYTKRFIPTKCTNEFKDCKTNRYYWLDHEGNFEGCLELLNLLDCENEVLKSENRQLKGKLMEYEEQIKGDNE